MSLPTIPRVCWLLGSARLDSKVSLHFLVTELRQEMALPPMEAGVVKRPRMGPLLALELVAVELALERSELVVCVN